MLEICVEKLPIHLQEAIRLQEVIITLHLPMHHQEVILLQEHIATVRVQVYHLEAIHLQEHIVRHPAQAAVHHPEVTLLPEAIAHLHQVVVIQVEAVAAVEPAEVILQEDNFIEINFKNLS